MKSFYRLVHFEFKELWFVTCAVGFCALVIPLILIQRELRHLHTHSVLERFEDVYVSAGNTYVFFFLFLILCLVFLRNFYAGYWGSKSIYTKMTIPVKRSVLYSTKCFAFIISITVLWVCQFASVFGSYQMFVSKINSLDEGHYLMTNGLFLAFTRSGFFRLLFPMTLEGLMSTVSIVIMIVTALYYAAVCERGKRYWGYAIVIQVIFMIFENIKIRMHNPYNVMYEQVPNLYWLSLVFFAISGYFIWYSIRLLKKGAIT